MRKVLKRKGWLLLAIALFFSILLNVAACLWVIDLERKVYLAKWRLMAFSGLTSAVVRTGATLGREDVISADVLCYPLDDEGVGFLRGGISYPGWGITYFFDDDQVLIGWKEWPPVEISDEHGRLRSLRDVVYEDDGISF